MSAEDGARLRQRAQGAKSGQLQEALARLDPDLARWADEFIFGEVWAREGLSVEERRLVSLTALAVVGDAVQLRNYLHGALQDGVPEAKLKETLLMTLVYAGFPAAIRALTLLHDVVESHNRGQRTEPEGR
jgi:4-carboxymuconolactone decarboxylase